MNGYKKTEIGVIPEDWEIINLGESSTLKARIGWQGLTTKEYLRNGDYFLITGTDFKNGKIDWENCCFVEENRYKQDKNIQIKKEDVLVTKDGTIGKIAYIDKIYKEATLNSGVFVIRPKNDRYNTEYFYNILMSKVFDEFLAKLSAGSTISHLYQKDFVYFDFPAPKNPEEQKAIAEALSDVDSLISSLEKLIDKKKKIKEGAMQELLTGKKRLEGFSGEWEVKRLGEIAEITGAGIDKKINPNEISVTLLNYMDVYKRDYIYKEELNHKVTAPYNKTISCNVKKGDIFLTPSSELRTDIAISAIAMEDMEGVVYSYHINRLRYKIEIDTYFGLYALKTFKFIKEAEKMCEGSGKRYVISLRKFKEMQIILPPTKEEQTAIAEILSDMDSEILSLETKLEKYKQIKQGMMQELLTGRIRLV